MSHSSSESGEPNNAIITLDAFLSTTIFSMTSAPSTRIHGRASCLWKLKLGHYQLPQDAPSLRGMIGNSTFLPNQMGHTAGGPQAGLVAQRFRTAFESPLDLAQV